MTLRKLNCDTIQFHEYKCLNIFIWMLKVIYSWNKNHNTQTFLAILVSWVWFSALIRFSYSGWRVVVFCSGTADGWHWSNSDGTEGGDRDQGDTGQCHCSHIAGNIWPLPTLSVSVILIMSSPCRGDVVSYKCSHCQDGKLIPTRNTSEPPTITVEESLGSSGRRNGWVMLKIQMTSKLKDKTRTNFRNDLSPVFIEMEMLGSNLEVERPSARRKKSKVSLTF